MMLMRPIDVLRGLRAVARLTMDPTRLEEVFVLASLAEESPQLHLLLEQLRATELGKKALSERPRLGKVDQAALGRLPVGTLGRAYADFMGARGLVHEDLVLVEGDGEFDFLRNHLRETHDLWHVATGFDTDVAGELGVQAFYLAQFDGPLPVMLIAVGMINALFRDLPDAPRRMEAMARGWLLGRRARPLFGLRWADRWSQPLEELRSELALELDEVDAFLARRGAEEALAEAA